MRATVVLMYPKFEVNVANALRACAIFGAEKLIVIGRRYEPATGSKGDRKPRPLRMKAYAHIPVEYKDAFTFPNSEQVVVVEKLEWATPLPSLQHPESACYIFGQEDGNVPKWIREKAKKFAVIPGDECLNLAMSVGIVLYDRVAKTRH